VSDPGPTPADDALSSRRQLACGWLVIAILFLAWRVPVMYREAGGMDEIYAVPGLTILKTGIPQLPHVPATNPESVFYRADRGLYSEPPVSFYVQAAFFAVLPHQYGTARLATAMSGLVLLFLLTKWLHSGGETVSAALWGIGLYSLSRWYFFLATVARPDILCTTFGVAALLAVRRWETSQHRGWLIVAGLLTGAGGLTHPFAIVYALQVAVWLMLVDRGRQRLLAPLIVAGTAIGTASLWWILIRLEPDIFAVQFRNQFLHGEGPGALIRLVWPWESLRYHFGKQLERVGAWQMVVAIIGWAALGVIGYRDRRPALIRLWWLTTTAIWLIAALVGPHHPVFGYWTYPAALAFLGAGCLVDRLLSALRKPWAKLMIGGLLVASFLPGSGLRTLVSHLRHWNDVDYNAPHFAQELLARIPADAVCVVDVEYALDFLVAGRKTLMAETMPMYFRADQVPYDYLIISRQRMGSGLVEDLGARLVERRGRFEDLSACYAEIYVGDRASTATPISVPRLDSGRTRGEAPGIEP
jgi:hypothetical protein